MFTSSHLIRYPSTFRLPVGHWLLDYSCFKKMTSPFRNPQNENTPIITISSGRPETEKESSSTKFKGLSRLKSFKYKRVKNRVTNQVHENQPTLDSNTTPTRMFLRRRIVLLTLALILAIVIITMTIVGLLISSYNERQQAEAEAREGQKTHSDVEIDDDSEKKTSSILSSILESGGSETDERDTFLPVQPAKTNMDSSGSGSEPSNTEKTSMNGKFVLLTDKFESFEEVGSGDSGDQQQVGSGDSSEDRHIGSGDSSGDRRDVGSGFQPNRPL
uniref:Uncharacterized protein n=1 Tax=Daphnia galeata TaxID=27404 RepID=A0A8J2RF09_9CRUS|nr:unnamed protein product [Daphnia galeata]